MTRKEEQKESEELLLRVRELAARQGVEPITDAADLRGDFWPEDESADDFLAWLRNLRREDLSRGLPE